MGQISCKGIYSNAKSLNCEVIPDPFVASVAQLNGIGSIVILLVELFMLAIFWFCTVVMIPRKDFVRNFLGAVFVPISLSVFTKLIRNIVNMAGAAQSGVASVLLAMDVYFYNVGSYTYIVGSVFFLLMIIAVAYQRKQIPPHKALMPYVGVLVFFACIALVNTIATAAAGGTAVLSSIGIVVGLFSLAGSIATCAICCVCCCCSKPRYEQDWSDPVVYNARTRMGWVFAFLTLSPLSSGEGNLQTMYSSTMGLDQEVRGFMEMLLNTVVFVQLLAPLVSLICTFALLPSYRDALFMGGSNRKEHRKAPTVPKTMVSPEPHVPHPTHQAVDGEQMMWVQDPQGGAPRQITVAQYMLIIEQAQLQQATPASHHHAS